MSTTCQTNYQHLFRNKILGEHPFNTIISFHFNFLPEIMLYELLFHHEARSPSGSVFFDVFLLFQGIPAGHSPCNRSRFEDCHPPPVGIDQHGVATEGGSSHDLFSVPGKHRKVLVVVVFLEVKLMENKQQLIVLQVVNGHGDCKSLSYKWWK